MMAKEGTWLATLLCVVLVTMMIVMPHGGRGRLPRVSDLEQRGAATSCNVPIVGPLLCELTAGIRSTTAALELVPY